MKKIITENSFFTQNSFIQFQKLNYKDNTLIDITNGNIIDDIKVSKIIDLITFDIWILIKSKVNSQYKI